MKRPVPVLLASMPETNVQAKAWGALMAWLR